MEADKALYEANKAGTEFGKQMGVECIQLSKEEIVFMLASI
jgi:hypothetical protein